MYAKPGRGTDRYESSVANLHCPSSAGARRAGRVALIRRRLNGFELRQAAREERRRGRRPRAERETRQMSLLDSAGE